MSVPSGVYAIRHLATGRLYVGSSCDIKHRLKQHRSMLARGRHHSKRLQADWDRGGGLCAFEFVTLEHCAQGELLEREQEAIDRLCPTYNSAPFTSAPMAGRKHTAETLAKLGLRPLSLAARERIAAAMRGNKHAAGSVRSRETRALLSAAQRGRVVGPPSAAARARMSASQLGNKKGLGRKVSTEIKARMSALFKGRCFSPDTIARMSAAQQRRRERAREHQGATTGANP